MSQLRALSNRSRYEECHKLALKLMKQYPREILFEHYEAVMTAEDDVNFTPAQIKARYTLAAKKLRNLLRRSRAFPPHYLGSVRNEYYWFSNQPSKQYRLGTERVREGYKRGGYYSQGVGAAQIAKKYALKGRKALALRWAKKSEKAWLSFLKLDPNWFNSYFFYAAALGYQGRVKEMDAAFARAARIAGKPPRWNAIRKYRAEALEVLAVLRRD